MVTLTFREQDILPRNCISEEESNLLPTHWETWIFFFFLLKNHRHVTHGQLKNSHDLKVESYVLLSGNF